jgi:hypothetical protein
MTNRTQQYPQYQPPVPPRVHRRSLWDRTWKDKSGKTVLWQRPNAWLIGWAVLTTISLLFTRRPADIISSVASLSLIIWALLEIFRGVNYYRRFLGAIVLLYAVAAILKSL